MYANLACGESLIVTLLSVYVSNRSANALSEYRPVGSNREFERSVSARTCHRTPSSCDSIVMIASAGLTSNFSVPHRRTAISIVRSSPGDTLTVLSRSAVLHSGGSSENATRIWTSRFGATSSGVPAATC